MMVDVTMTMDECVYDIDWRIFMKTNEEGKKKIAYQLNWIFENEWWI